MLQLIESIQVRNKQLQNVHLHNERLNRSRKDLFFCTLEIDIMKVIKIPQWIENKIYKLRIIYSEKLISHEFIEYIPRKIQRLTCIFDSDINYRYKFENRACFAHYLSVSMSEDILIVKNNDITDTSFSNICFFDGVKWLTPGTFLLNGTKRQLLLGQGIIEESEIKFADLKYFKSAKLINAMLDWDESQPIDISNIC